MNSKNKLKEELYNIISNLPQYRFLKKKNIDRWIDHVSENYPSSAIWLAKRLGAIGGSEIGVFVQIQRNQKAQFLEEIGFTFCDDSDILKEKLLITLPQTPDHNMKRGSRLEPIAADMYHEQLHNEFGDVRRRPDLVKKSGIINVLI